MLSRTALTNRHTDMKTRYLLAAMLVAACTVQGAAKSPEKSGGLPGGRQGYTINVDAQGVLRRSDTRREAAYYGTNYTAPFAYAYRALGYLGVDRKEAIRRDVYHLARLGLNAFRLHLWDVELADAQGNLQANDHLDLLDFLIAELERRGIDIVLTAQTNFGNGYPEDNIDTGGFSYDFDKCGIHEDPEAQAIQENYLQQLVSHVNPYTGLSYAADRAVIAMEVNNEPCHSGTPQQVTDYINRMAKALRKAGFDKPILYNVTHNPSVTDAYYKADIQGTTYQWYPTGLVNGHERTGNFLPHVDEYPIPWEDTMPGYTDKARFIYEFDPADVLSANLYPAIVRTLRGKGFQWITQFAYDPLDLARFNTEYQTHFLNLAYTPAKAISMLIATQAMQEVPRDADYGSYPANTTFGHTSLSTEGKGNSLHNSPTKFYHTAATAVKPVNPELLQHLAGVGSNPVVTYAGTGAWFLDKLDGKHWRLEVMPDVELTADPFATPSLNREVARITYSVRPMHINLPSLGCDFILTPLNEGNTHAAQAQGRDFTVRPGVYLLSNGTPDTAKWAARTPFGADAATAKPDNMLLGEYAAPAPTASTVAGHSGDKPSATEPVNPQARVFPEIMGVWLQRDTDAITGKATYMLQFTPEKEDSKAVLQADVNEADKALLATYGNSALLTLRFPDKPMNTGEIKAGFIDRDGVAYVCTFTPDELTTDEGGNHSIAIPVAKLTPLDKTPLLPTAYPTITATTFTPTVSAANLRAGNAEHYILIFSGLTPAKQFHATIPETTISKQF